MLTAIIKRLAAWRAHRRIKAEQRRWRRIAEEVERIAREHR